MKRRSPAAFLCTLILGALILGAPALGAPDPDPDAPAQTRAGEIGAGREEKARALRPETVSWVEDIALQFKERKVLERMAAGYNGLRFQMGDMATGSGFAAGPQFSRRDLLDGRLRVEASASLSTHLWQKYRASVAAPRLAGGRLVLEAEAIRRDYRALEFYGMGAGAPRGDRTAYRLRDTSLEGRAGWRPTRRFRLGGSLGALWPSIGPGEGDDIPSIEEVFGEASAPGLDRQPDYFLSSVFGQFDYRDDPAGPKAGGNYVTEYTWHRDRALGAYGFGRWDIDVQQYLPFFNRSRRFALRARATLTHPGDGQRVPFYLQPYLGGSDDLRGFRPYRFTGPNAIVYNAEYRWEIFSGLDGALFFDAGKTMSSWGHWGLSGLRTSGGIGFRFNARNRTFTRIDIGVSEEGAVVWLKFNDPFLPRLFGAGTRQPLY
ncbi:MAG: BamA/TamA family outer membrane protein [Acidobacteria bacterium]|nr:BamA/TamA family outer membrane protein [Acidobacteriota bacterium]